MRTSKRWRNNENKISSLSRGKYRWIYAYNGYYKNVMYRKHAKN
jgi:hypothetical protein